MKGWLGLALLALALPRAQAETHEITSINLHLPIPHFAYAQNEKAQQRRANVIFILTDDQGYGPIARHGDVNE